MNLRSIVAVSAVAVLAAACGRQESATGPDGTWVGTITTEGNVTTVINESGSVWRGTARLIEEASIGVDVGDDAYMFGRVTGVWATGEAIYVVDMDVPAVRVYDTEGRYLRDLGGPGQGPGEYTRPALITGDSTGRLFVQDSSAGRFLLFSKDGETLGTWPARTPTCCAYPGVVGPNGNLWMSTRVRDEETRETRYALQEHGPDGPVGEFRWPDELDFVPAEIDVTTGGRTSSISAPFSPRSVWVIAPSGAIVTGASDRYRFEIQSADGAVLAVEKQWTPVAIGADEADWWQRYFVSPFRTEGDDDLTWDGDGMPTTKPAFLLLVPTHSGSIWVNREGPGERLVDCAEDPIEAGTRAATAAPCWRSRVMIDVFDAEGRYMGDVEVPPGFRAWAAYLNVRGNQVVSVVEDEAGTIMVKRYRLVLPGER